MINRLPLDQIHQIRDVVFAEAERDGRRMGFAVVDEAAGLIFAERMERCDGRVLTHAMRKAYTSAVMKRSTLFFRDQNAELAKSLADWGDPGMTQLPGGVELRVGEDYYGAIGVGGNTPERDVELAELASRLAVEALSGTHR